MNILIKDMSYKEFKDYCNERACDGKWSIFEAMACINIICEIDGVKVRTLGFTRKKLTEQKREEVWEERKKLL